MTDTPPPAPPPAKLPSVKPPKGTASGEHPAVREMRARLESYDEHQLAELRALSERTARTVSRLPDPRRDGTSDPPTDVVVFPPAPSEPDLEPDSDATPEPSSEP